jgi:hypothetical protein
MLMGHRESTLQLSSRIAGPVVSLALIAWAYFVIARVPLISGLHVVNGDPLDGLLAIAIQAHWPNVLTGQAIDWRTTNFFYPVPDTLGYNDGFLLHGLLLALFRAAGANILHASLFTDWAFRIIGFVSFWTLARRNFGWPPLIEVLAATLFVTANGYYMHDAIHSQFLACNLLPLLLLLGIEEVRSACTENIGRFALWCLLFNGLTGGLFLTSYYVAFFGFLILSLLVGVFLIDWALIQRSTYDAVRRLAPFIAVHLVATAICLVPFLAIYLPKAIETGMHPISELQAYKLHPFDVVNVGPYNLIWARFLSSVSNAIGRGGFQGFESQTGVPPALFALFALSGWVTFRCRDESPAPRLLFLGWCATCVTLFVAIQWGRLWVWPVLYQYLPGARAVRVVSRIQLVTILPITILACEVIAQSWQQLGARIAIGVLAAFLLFEQVNAMPVALLDVSSQIAFLEKVTRVPGACRVFFAENARLGPDVEGKYRHNVDAMLVAELSGVPTVNGMGTFTPVGWSLSQPQNGDYLSRVRQWLSEHNLAQGICGVDFQTGDWHIDPR